MEKYGALLHESWEARENDACKITGYWAEDNNEYEIIVPHQLRDLVVEMQNDLCFKYQKIIDMENELAMLKRESEAIFK